MIDLVTPAITAGLCVISGATAWIVRATRTQGDVQSVERTVSDVKMDHTKRLDGHDVDILDLRANYVSRREFDDKLASSMAAINGNYANIKEQLTTHGRWLEYAVFNKKPDQPSING